MEIALEEAGLAAAQGDVPVGAVTVLGDEIIARGHNMREALNDPTAHAEVLVIRESAMKLGRWRLNDLTLYVTIEPCVMCAGAIVLARIPRIVFGAKDPKAGGCGSVFQVVQEPLLNHRVEIVSGIKEESCRRILQEFFENRRNGQIPPYPPLIKGDLNIDELVKSQNIRSFVIPTKVGIQSFQCVAKPMDSRFHGNDDFLRIHQH